MGPGKWSTLLACACACACATACGGHSVREVAEGAAGTTTAQPTPTPPSNNPGPTDEPEPDDPAPMPTPDEPTPPDELQTLPVPCAYEELFDLCSNSNIECPKGIDAFADDCANGLEVRRGRTSCGGTVVVVGYAFGQNAWYFDAEGKLRGQISSGDLVEICADGHATNARIYGEVCPRVGALTNYCKPTDDCADAPHMCNAGPTCPLHSADVLSAYCSAPGLVSLAASSTTCGGSMVTVDRLGVKVRYCYDTRDQLIGIASRQSDGSLSVSGTDCRAEGMSTYPCLPL